MTIPSFWGTALDAGLADTSRDLTQDTLDTLIVSVSCIYGAWLFFAGMRWPDLLAWQFWVVGGAVVVTTALSHRLLKRHVLAAEIVWLVGLTATNTLTIVLFQLPQVVIFFALLPLIVVVTLDWPAGVVAGGVIGAVVWMLSTGRMAESLAPFTSITLAGTLIAGITGWATRRTLVTAIQHSIHYADQAQHNMDEARQHRAQLVVAHKNLDLAYYRLERVNATLIAARKQAEEAERLKSEFVTYISHEMRTPLNLIAGFSETILTSPESYQNVVLPGLYRQDINRISQSAQYLLKLIDDIIDLAKVDVGRISIERETLDVTRLVNEAVSMVRDYIHARGLNVTVNAPPSLPAVVGDRLRIHQVLLNLLVNAVRFTEAGWIRVDVTQTKGEILVKVADSGRGIPSADLPRVFEEFRTTDRADAAWHSGGGLGLPISKKLVELHDGKMGVNSVAGQGSTFWFTLPLGQKAESKPAAPYRLAAPELLQDDAAERAIVVVSQDTNVTKVLRRYLDGYRILAASDVPEALAVAETERPAAILAGYEAVLPQQATDAMIVRCPLPDWKKHFQWAEVANVLRKPITARELHGAIAQSGVTVKRLLIVEDDPDMVQMLRRILSTHPGIETYLEAQNGIAALQMMAAARPDIVLLDITLPEMNGYQVLSKMAEDPQLADIPVIIVSGTADDYMTEALEGAITFSRPGGFKFNEIIQSLNATLATLTPGWRLERSSDAKPDKAQSVLPA